MLEDERESIELEAFDVQTERHKKRVGAQDSERPGIDFDIVGAGNEGGEPGFAELFDFLHGVRVVGVQY